MKKTLIFSIGLGLILPFSTFSPAIANDALQTVNQKASYTLASDLAKNFKEQGVNIDSKAFMLGLEDTLNNRPSKLSDEEMMNAISTVQKQIMSKQEADRKEKGLANIKEGEEYLSKNAKKPGVKTLENGIQYKVIESGQGKSPTENDTIFAHYEGKFINGEVFDSSYDRGTPLKFVMSNVIKGWGEVLKIMKPGDKWEVVIPSDLAYREKGAGERIGPNKTLVFTIELIQFDTSK